MYFGNFVDILPPAPPENSPTGISGNPSTGIFTHEQTLAIISGYKDRKDKFSSPTHKKKTLWREMTDELNKNFSTNFSASQVEGRWKTQLSAFKRHQTDQAKSGQEKKDFPYEEQFQDLFHDRHDITPKYMVASLSSDHSGSTTDEPCTSSSCSGSSEPGSDSEPRKKRKVSAKTNTTQVINFLENYVESQNQKNEDNVKKIEKMHKEKMEVFNGFLTVLKTMKE
jgi:hypothetical protein